MYYILFTLMAMCVPSTAPNTFGNAAISNNLCLMRICSATVDGNLMKFFTILLRALDTLKTIRFTLDWLIPTVLLKTSWSDPEPKKRRATIICSITGRGEDLFVYRCKLSLRICARYIAEFLGSLYSLSRTWSGRVRGSAWSRRGLSGSLPVDNP